MEDGDETIKEFMAFQQNLLEEMEAIPEEWCDKLGTAKNGMLYTRYWPGRGFTEGYDYIHIFFASKMDAKIFLNKHHDQCGGL